MHADTFLRETAEIAARINRVEIEALATLLHKTREQQGRVHVIGLGGSYSNAEHFAADLRKLCEIEAYAPNVAEMSAWLNDAGDGHAFDGHLRFMKPNDILLVLSVGGGTWDVSRSLCIAVGRAKRDEFKVAAIVGPSGGFTAANADCVVKVPAGTERVTPHAEAFQAVVWHCLVSHPLLQKNSTKW